MPENETHAFQIWRDAGYTTGLIGKNHCFVDLDVFDVYCDLFAWRSAEGQLSGRDAGDEGYGVGKAY